MSDNRHDDPETPFSQKKSGYEPIFNLPGIIIALIVVCGLVHFVRSYLLTFDQDFWVLVHFAFIPARYSAGYGLDVYAILAPWTYSFMHGGIAHLVVNMVWLAVFGSPLANRLGKGRFLLFWLFTAFAAVSLHFILHFDEAVPLVGASGAISGMMGAAARFGFAVERRAGKGAFAGPVRSISAVLRMRSVVSFLLVWMAANLLMGLVIGSPQIGGQIAWEAHIGGFVAGFFFIRLFDPLDRKAT